MQMEMEAGGRLFFDLFVAMVNHMVSPDFTYSQIAIEFWLRMTLNW